MTTEDDFQIVLDARPEDWQTRLVFADWLEEHGDPRAEGTRALVAVGRRALPCQMAPSAGRAGAIQYIFGSGKVDIEQFKVQYALCLIPTDWFDLFVGSLYDAPGSAYWKHYRTRRGADDAAARAFAQLPDKRRAELLKPPG